MISVLLAVSLAMLLWMLQLVIRSNNQLKETARSLQETKNLLTHSEKLASLGRVVTGIAHNLDNPLTAIIGFSDLILNHEDTALSPELRKGLEIIFKEGQNCRHIVQNLLSFARRRKPKWEKTDVCAVLTDTLAAPSLRLDQKKVTVKKSYPPKDLSVKADLAQLKEVFSNLLKNAVQAMEKNASEKIIRIGVVQENENVLVTFADNGHGIAPENIHKIFEPFFTTKEPSSGTGLGLSICYGIVHEHGGEIVAESPPGQGVVMTVCLPLLGAKEALELASQSTPTPGALSPAHGLSGRRVLVIEDEESVREFLGTVLSSAGMKVDMAQDGQDALEKAAANPYDLLIVDYIVPKMNGEQIYRELIRKNPAGNSKFLFITSQTGDRHLLDFFKTNNLVYLPKPFLKKELLEIAEKKLHAKNAPPADAVR